MNVDAALARACELVPGLLHGVLAALPEGLLIGGVGDVSAFEREPLIRCAAVWWRDSLLFAVLCEDRASVAAVTARHLAQA